MKKSVIFAALFLFAFVVSGISQRYDRTADRETARSERHAFKKDRQRGDCKKLKKHHMRKMRKMAAADGRITPREQRMMRKERRRVF